MADKLPPLEDIARAEEAENLRREQMKKTYLAMQQKLLEEMPTRFFTMARQIRDGVQRFNGAAKLTRYLTYTETPSVTTRDTNPAADFVVEIRREPNHGYIAMRQMRRLHLPDALIIEGEGQVGPPMREERFQLRIDGVIKEEKVVWRIMSEGQKVDTPIDELGERFVAVIATGELSRLWQLAPYVERSR